MADKKFVIAIHHSDGSVTFEGQPEFNLETKLEQEILRAKMFLEKCGYTVMETNHYRQIIILLGILLILGTLLVILGLLFIGVGRMGY